MNASSALPKVKLAIPKDRENLYRHIVNACTHLGIEYQIYNIYSNNWIDEIRDLNPTGCIYSGEFRYSNWRELFRERIKFIGEHLKIPLYPKLYEYDMWESKRRMSYWLKANAIPHPETWVFGDGNEALEFINCAKYPIVFKTDFGSASVGVRIVKNRKEALNIWRQAFGNGYRIPTYDTSSIDFKNRLKALLRPIYRRVVGIRDIPRDIELDTMLLQSLIDIKTEWRIIKSGDMYFGHQKLPNPTRKNMRSGSSLVGWIVPPIELLEFARAICVKGAFSTMCLDIFEDFQGRYYVNELQTIFGAFAPNQMYRECNGTLVPFKMRLNSTGEWIEELGEYGQDYHYRTRLLDFLRNLQGDLHISGA